MTTDTELVPFAEAARITGRSYSWVRDRATLSRKLQLFRPEARGPMQVSAAEAFRLMQAENAAKAAARAPRPKRGRKPKIPPRPSADAQEGLDRFLRRPEVESLIGLKASQIYALVNRGEFPAPIKLGAASRWSLIAVRAWMAERVREAGFKQ